VGSSLDEPVQAQAAQVVAHPALAVVLAEVSGDEAATTPKALANGDPRCPT
jgi:hypothetical protein